jgi:hypothetical protein
MVEAVVNSRSSLLFMIRIFLSLLLITGFFGGYAQTACYDISVAGFKIGYLNTVKCEQGVITVYKLHSEVSFRFIFEVKVIHDVTTIYEHGNLVKTTIETIINKTPYVSKTEWKDGHYDILINTYKYFFKGQLLEFINYSTSMLYFVEPDKITRVFAENYGIYAGLKALGNHSYQMSDRKNMNLFYYKEGALVGVEMGNPIKNFYLKRRK